MAIQISKPFRSVEEGMIYKPSIIAHCKKPWLMERIGQVEKCLQYKHFLYINLWIAELTFEFEWPRLPKDVR